jgi:hypothetical protein
MSTPSLRAISLAKCAVSRKLLGDVCSQSVHTVSTQVREVAGGHGAMRGQFDQREGLLVLRTVSTEHPAYRERDRVAEATDELGHAFITTGGHGCSPRHSQNNQ